MIIAVANQKGGVGKTTTAISLAGVWASEGRRVLLVDMDPQGNATSGLGLEEGMLDWTVAEVLKGGRWEPDAVLHPARNIDLLPAHIGLAVLETESLDTDALQRVLAGAPAYDRIVIDCPPSLGRLSLCALAAAERALVPIRAGKFSVYGLRQLLTTIDNLRVRGFAPSLRPVGIFFNEAQTRTNLHQATEELVRKMFGELVLDTVVPSNVALGEAATVGEPITRYDPTASGARAFESLAREVESKWQRIVRTA